MNKTILLVEDNPDILSINRAMLLREGYRVLCAETLAEGEAQLTQNPDLVILDIMLPDGNGLDYCRKVRTHSSVPILFLTGLSENSDIVTGLVAGGDDYLPKPYDLDVLAARVAALLRRVRPAAPEPIVTTGPLQLETTTLRATLNGQDLLLTPREFAILLHLVRNKGQTVSAKALYEATWGRPAAGDVRAVRSHVSRLRAKLTTDSSGIDIAAEYGKGYRFVTTQEL